MQEAIKAYQGMQNFRSLSSHAMLGIVISVDGLSNMTLERCSRTWLGLICREHDRVTPSSLIRNVRSQPMNL